MEANDSVELDVDIYSAYSNSCNFEIHLCLLARYRYLLKNHYIHITQTHMNARC